MMDINHELGFQSVNSAMEILWHETPQDALSAYPLGVDERSSVPMQQHPHYGAALGQLGRRSLYAQINQNDRTIASALVVLRTVGAYCGLALLPRGPVWHGAVCDHQKRRAIEMVTQTLPLPTLRGLVINAEHPDTDAPLQQAGHSPIVTGQHIGEIDLFDTKDARLGRQHVKWRNRLRAAQKSRLKVTHHCFAHEIAQTSDHWLLQQDARQRRAKKFRALPAAFTTAYARANPNATRLFVARFDGAIVAAMLFLMHGTTATYHIGWTSAEGRLLSAHNLILWKASNWFAQQGYCGLDLGTVDTESAAGLARFKIGTGAQIRALGATYLYTPLTAGPTRLMAHVPPRRRNIRKNA